MRELDIREISILQRVVEMDSALIKGGVCNRSERLGMQFLVWILGASVNLRSSRGVSRAVFCNVET